MPASPLSGVYNNDEMQHFTCVKSIRVNFREPEALIFHLNLMAVYQLDNNEIFQYLSFQMISKPIRYLPF